MAYSDNNFNSMQEEAIRRVKEMQKRSRSIVDGGEEEKNEEKKVEKIEETPLQNEEKGKKNILPAADLLEGIFGEKSGKGELFNIGGIKIDEEKALIGLLIYILYKQDADIKLLLGLGYLLL